MVIENDVGVLFSHSTWTWEGGYGSDRFNGGGRGVCGGGGGIFRNHTNHGE
jgi:hypothetical protein